LGSRAPRVGITLCIDRGQRWRPGMDYYYVSRSYAARIREVGGEPVLLGLDSSPERAPQYCDALLITGGDDLPRSLPELDALCVGEVNSAEAPLGPAEDRERIAWDRELLAAFDAQGRAVLGICYGMQLMNLHYGGTLYRDLSTEHTDALPHGGGGNLTRHGLQLGESVLWVPGDGTVAAPEVNSNHRQAVREVAPGFRATARATDGVIEAIERGPLCGVQWHPESDPGGAALFTAFLRAAG
jgi:putative glutamine amidotransferase